MGLGELWTGLNRAETLNEDLRSYGDTEGTEFTHESECVGDLADRFRPRKGSSGLVHARALVIIRYHDWPGCARPDHSPVVVKHSEVHIKPDLFPVMSTIAGYPEGQDDRAR